MDNYVLKVPFSKFRKLVLGRTMRRLMEDISSCSSPLPLPFQYPPPPSLSKKRISIPIVLDPQSNLVVRSRSLSDGMLISHWSPIFSSPRPFCLESLSTALESFPPGPNTPSEFTYSSQRLKKIICLLPKSAPGPDGIPFSFFKRHRRFLKPSIKRVICDIAAIVSYPPKFSTHISHSSLSLLEQALLINLDQLLL